MRVLVADDDAVDRQATRRALAATGMTLEITEAETGASALEMLEAGGLDAVLLDFRLPDADGLEILRDARARRIATPIVVLTGYGDEQVAVDLMKSGAADYLSKSRLSPDLLAQSLRHIQRISDVRAEAEAAEGDRERLLLNLAAEQGQTDAILTSMTDGLVVSDLAGNILTMNPAALAMHDISNSTEARQPLPQLEDILELLTLEGEPMPLSDWPLPRVLRGEKFSHCEVIVRRLDTGRTWIANYGGTPVQSSSGEAILAIVTVQDITERRQAEARTALLAEAGSRLSASLDAQTTLETLTDLVVPDLADWCAVYALGADSYVQPLIAAQTGASREEAWSALPPAAPLNPNAAHGLGYVLRTKTGQLLSSMKELRHGQVQDDALWTHLHSLGVNSYLCVPLIVRGVTVGALSLALTGNRRTYGEEDLTLATELGQRVAAGLENVRLFYDAQARAEREALINKINSALRVSLDQGEILRSVTEQVGMALGVSRCRFLSLDEFRDALEASPFQYTAPNIAPETRPSLVAEWPAEAAVEWSAGRSVTGSGPDAASWAACPVFLRGQFGGIFLAEQTEGPRAWTTDDLHFLSAVTDILALALENARLYAREHRVADMLSSAFLTDIPDELPGLALAANYRAGLEEAQVGGDYYDAFTLPDGRVALVIADVSGKGLSAAVQTATVKYSLRAFATEAGAPGLVMTRLNKMLCSDLAGLGDHFVTLFYAVFDSATGRLSWTSAGHEAVLIKRAGGSSLLNANGPILGLAEHTYAQEVSVLAPGDSLVLYTDGLTEARNGERTLLDIDGVQALVEAAPAEAWPGALAAHLQSAAMRWTNGRPQDDMALLVARCLAPAGVGEDALQTADPEPGPKTEPGPKIAWDTADGDDLFHFHFPSRADYVVEVRQALGHWMATLGYDRAATEDFQTAVTEAVTNAVRHGSPGGEAGEFHVLGRRTSVGALHVEVTDSGSGLAGLPLAPAMPEPEALGGRGLPLMQELADAVEFHPDPSGLCVVLVKYRPDSN